jgi:hypothetical protein
MDNGSAGKGRDTSVNGAESLQWNFDLHPAGNNAVLTRWRQNETASGAPDDGAGRLYFQVILFHGTWVIVISSSPKWRISLMRCLFVVSHTIHQTEITAISDSWVTNAPSVKMLRPQNKNCLFLYLCVSKHNMHTYWTIGNRSISPPLCKIVYRWVTKNCCFISYMDFLRQFSQILRNSTEFAEIFFRVY